MNTYAQRVIMCNLNFLSQVYLTRFQHLSSENILSLGNASLLIPVSLDQTLDSRKKDYIFLCPQQFQATVFTLNCVIKTSSRVVREIQYLTEIHLHKVRATILTCILRHTHFVSILKEVNDNIAPEINMIYQTRNNVDILKQIYRI